MAITGSNPGPLSMDNILTGIGDEAGEQIDFVGFGYLIGATDGVVGSGDSVILPDDFWGQDVNKTATSISVSPTTKVLNNSSHNFNITVTSNGIGKVSNIPEWVDVSETYFTGNTTLNFTVDTNASLGSQNRSGTLDFVGQNDVVKATLSIEQTGNPATITFSVSGITPSQHIFSPEGFNVNISNNLNFESVTVGDSDLRVVFVTNVNSKTKAYQLDWTTSGPTYQTTDLTSTITAVASSTSDSNQTMQGVISVTIPGYDAPHYTGQDPRQFDNDGQTHTFTMQGTTGATFEITGHDSLSGFTLSPTTGNVGDTITMTYTANDETDTRGGTITITDTTTGAGGSTDTFDVTQPPQELNTWTVSPTSLTWAHDDTTQQYASITIVPNTGFSNQVTVSRYYSGGDFQHQLVSGTGNPSSTGWSSDNSDLSAVSADSNGALRYYVRPGSVNSSITTDRVSTPVIRSVANSTGYTQTMTLTHSKDSPEFGWWYEEANSQSGRRYTGSSWGYQYPGTTFQNPFGYADLLLVSTSNSNLIDFRVRASPQNLVFTFSSAPTNPMPADVNNQPQYQNLGSMWQGPNTNGYYYVRFYAQPNNANLSSTQAYITPYVRVNQGSAIAVKAHGTDVSATGWGPIFTPTQLYAKG